MKRRYMTLGVLLAVSMAAVVAVGSVQKSRILKPLELDGGLDPAQVPFVLATDDDLNAQIDIARELIAEENAAAKEDQPAPPPETPVGGNAQSTDNAAPPVTGNEDGDPVNTPDEGQDNGDSENNGNDENDENGSGAVDPPTEGSEDTASGSTPPEADDPQRQDTDDETGENGDPGGEGQGEEPPEVSPEDELPPEEPLTVTVGTSGEFTPEKTVDDSWFDDVLFIGDSRTEGLRLYSRIGGADYFAATGMSVYSALTKKTSDKGFSEQTLPELLSKKTYGKIFIGLGINECGSSFKSLTKAYTKLVDTVREAQPDAVIILQAIMTTGHKKEAQNICYGPENLFRINEMICSLADGEHIFYINVNEVFADGEGYLPDSFSGDGCHLYAKYYPLWVSWIKSAVADIPVSGGGAPAADEPADGESPAAGADSGREAAADTP